MRQPAALEVLAEDKVPRGANGRTAGHVSGRDQEIGESRTLTGVGGGGRAGPIGRSLGRTVTPWEGGGPGHIRQV